MGFDADEKRKRDERLAALGLLRHNDQRPRCVHCGQPFAGYESTGGEFGICQECIDNQS
jgi:hypothetical protein